MFQSSIKIKNLFDEVTHKKIIKYINLIVRFQPNEVDDKTFIRYYRHNDPFFYTIHHQLTEFASSIFKEEVKPSYSFLSMYKSGGTCPLHIDREQCRYTIDYLIQTDEIKSWPINIGKHMSDEERSMLKSKNKTSASSFDELLDIMKNQSFESFDMQPNDAVAYSGTHQWHYRPVKLNSTADLVFFHFVPKDFNGPLE